MNLRLNPALGVEVTGSISGPSFTIIGPTGSLGATTTGGIQYTDGAGWMPVQAISWGGMVSPLTASFDPGISFGLNSSAYGSLGVAVDGNLGYPPFSLNLASLEFLSFRGDARLDASFTKDQ